jgi:WD40 repeat protein/tRNA A-37 threonylcarbamoyl transferase component Bud32
MSQDDQTWDLPLIRKGGSSSGLDSTLPGRSGTSPQGSAPQLPQVEVDRYDLSGEFARGAIGRILKARDRRLDRPVAIKELIQRGGDVEARFVTEALITARLQHPSIVPVYEAGRWATGEPFYAMKFVSGRSLADVISEKHTLQDRLALLPHVLAVAEAIAYAHTERIIHRDLKPANVLVGAFGETVVIDWGLAKDLARDSSAEASLPPSVPGLDASLTHQGMVVGTPAYMPPEQAAGRPVDERADVYALGAILYHLLAGTRPYDTGSSAQVIDQVVRGPPTPLGQRQKAIPADLLAIVAKAMARDPLRRYATARELAEDLRRFQTGQIVGAHAYSLGERFVRFVKRYRAVVAVTAVALLILIGMGTASFQGVLAARDRAEHKQAEAEQAQHDAESARKQALERADELTLLHARTAVERDPNEVITWLSSLSPGFSHWSAVRTIAADARARGFATVLRGHEQTIDDLVFSRDGKHLITSSDDYTIRIWDFTASKPATLTGHTDEVWRLAISPDGKTLASASKDRTVRLWNMETNTTRLVLVHPGPVDTVAFTPDGRYVLSTNRGDDVLRMWDVKEGTLARSFTSGLGQLGLLVLSPDGRYALVQSLKKPSAQLWDLEHGTSRLLTHTNSVTAIAFSPRGDLAATGSMDQTVHVWNVQTGVGRTLGEKLGAISCLAFSPEGGRLAAGTSEGQLRLWDLAKNTGELLGSHEGRINDMLFYPDGNLLATSSDDRTAQLWDLTSGHNRSLRGLKGAAFAIDFSPDGKWLAVASYDTTVRLFAVMADGNRLLAETPVFLNTLATSPNGDHLASVGADGMVRLFEVASGKTVMLAGPAVAEDAQVQFSPDGRWLAVGGRDGMVRLWNVTTGQLARTLERHTGAVTTLFFRRDSQTLATADTTGEVRVWELSSGQGRLLYRHEHGVLQVTYSPDGLHLASGSAHGDIRVWDFSTGQPRELLGHEDQVRSLMFSPDGKRLISGSMDHTLRIWDLATGDSKIALASGNGVQRIVMSLDGNLLISSNVKDSTLRMWDGHTADKLGVIQGHQGDITDLVLSPDGRRLASTSLDRTVRLWDLATNETRVLRGHAARATGVVFLDNEHLASASWDGSVRLWPDDLPTTPEGLRAWMKAIAGGP